MITFEQYFKSPYDNIGATDIDPDEYGPQEAKDSKGVYYFYLGKRSESQGKYDRYYDHYLHNEDGPAVIKPSGSKGWYIENELHREDGPAIE